MISIFKQCKRCFGPSYLKCTWLNSKYFGNGEAVIVQNELSNISTLIINNVEKNKARLIRGIKKDIVFVLEGVIGGLLNGKIALHQEGNFLKPCPENSQNRAESFPISLKIFNSNTKEVLATYSAIFEN